MEYPYIFKVLHLSVLPLLAELEKLGFIEILEPGKEESSEKLSDKYRGMFTKEDAARFDAHVKAIRDEWDNRL